MPSKDLMRVLQEFWKTPKRSDIFICDALSDLVSLVQFKKDKKHPCKSVTFSKKLQGET